MLADRKAGRNAGVQPTATGFARIPARVIIDDDGHYLGAMAVRTALLDARHPILLASRLLTEIAADARALPEDHVAIIDTLAGLRESYPADSPVGAVYRAVLVFDIEHAP